MEPKLLIHVTYQAKPGRGREFVRQIVSQGLRGKILAEDGCLQYDYFFSSESDDTVLLVELWETAAHQAVHMTQPHMKALAFHDDSEAPRLIMLRTSRLRSVPRAGFFIFSLDSTTTLEFTIGAMNFPRRPLPCSRI